MSMTPRQALYELTRMRDQVATWAPPVVIRMIEEMETTFADVVQTADAVDAALEAEVVASNLIEDAGKKIMSLCADMNPDWDRDGEDLEGASQIESLVEALGKLIAARVADFTKVGTDLDDAEAEISRLRDEIENGPAADETANLGLKVRVAELEKALADKDVGIASWREQEIAGKAANATQLNEIVELRRQLAAATAPPANVAGVPPRPTSELDVVISRSLLARAQVLGALPADEDDALDTILGALSVVHGLRLTQRWVTPPEALAEMDGCDGAGEVVEA